MYLDQYFGNHSFRAENVCDNINGNYPGIHFCDIRYENEENPFQVYNRPNEIFIQGNRPLGVKLSTLLNGRYSSLSELNNNKIRIERKGQNYLFSVEDELIGIIRDADDWDNILTTQWEKNDDSGFDDKDQAVFFGTTIEEINAQFSLIKKQKRLTRCRKPVFPLNINQTNLISYGAAISSSFNDNRNESDKQDYYGTEVRLDSVSGGKDGEVTYTRYDYTLFPLKREEFEELYKQLNDDILTIDNNSSYSFLEKPFFKSIIENRGNNNLNIYIWIRFENVGDISFDSYSFAVSYNKDIFSNVIIPQEANFLRQIFYLSNLSTKLLIEENKQKNEDQRRQSVKTAIGSIMSRNMSHNLGSHFLYYTRRDLEKDQKSYYSLFHELKNAIEIDKQLVEISNSCGAGCTELNQVKESIKSIIKPNNEESKKHASYILKIYYTRLAIDLINNKKREGKENIESIIASVYADFTKKRFPTIFQNKSGLANIYKQGLLPFSYLSAYEAQNENNKEYWKGLGGASHVIDFCKNRMNYIAAVVEDKKYPSMPVPLSSIIKELLLDDPKYNKEHILNNYYLGNIIRSEGYTRKPYIYHRENDNFVFNVICDNGCNINDIILSLPGGTLSIHAFYNIIENFIRNSAKYQATGKKDKLVFTLRVATQGNWAKFYLSDNKNDAETSFKQIIENINELKFLNDDGTINQSYKGLKEMILSYLWLISWSYPDISLGDILFHWDTINEKDSKQMFLRTFIRGLVDDYDDLAEMNFGRINNDGKVINVAGNLCLHFTLPLHNQNIRINADNKNSLNSIKNTDLAILDNFQDEVKKSFIYKHFPRVAIQSPNYSSQDYLEDALNNRLGTDIAKISMKYGEFSEQSSTPPQIIYEGHQNTKGFTLNEINEYWGKEYFDSISGGNYTGKIKDTIQTDERIRLLAKESALTRITIIDERIADEIKWINKDIYFDNSIKKPFKGTQVEQSLKNIRILNYFEEETTNQNMKEVKGFEILKGNEFRKVGPLCNYENATHFLTIHLGLIEKMLKNSAFLEKDSFCGKRDNDSISAKRVQKLMAKIKSIFFTEDTIPFICIHSGRGGLSSELKQTELKDYPFIPYITLESLFNDSKFLLSYMLYSQIYQNTK